MSLAPRPGSPPEMGRGSCQLGRSLQKNHLSHRSGSRSPRRAKGAAFALGTAAAPRTSKASCPQHPLLLGTSALSSSPFQSVAPSLSQRPLYETALQLLLHVLVFPSGLRNLFNTGLHGKHLHGQSNTLQHWS